MTAASAPELSRLGRAAVYYASKGWAVFPCVPRGKEPLGRLAPRGCRSASSDPRHAFGTWTTEPAANIGLATGPVSGLWALDVDPRHGGEQTLDDLTAEHGPLPDTLIQETGGGGLHYLFTWPTDGGMPRHSPGPGLDVKGDGGYLIAAPSVHPETCRRYTWQEPAGELCAAPEWLLGLVCERPEGNGRATPPDAWARLVAGPIPAGERNATLARVAGYLFRYLPAPVAADLAECWAEVRLRPPLEAAEIRKTIASIARAELGRRDGAR